MTLWGVLGEGLSPFASFALPVGVVVALAIRARQSAASGMIVWDSGPRDARRDMSRM